MGGSHSLETFINEVARSATDPQTNVSVRERARALAIVRAASDDDRREARDRGNLRIAALGSGSDYTPFLQHLGVASLSIGFGGEDSGGSYHSIYDSIAHYQRFGDPGFVYGDVLAKFGGGTTCGWRKRLAPDDREAAGRNDRPLRAGADEAGRNRANIHEESQRPRTAAISSPRIPPNVCAATPEAGRAVPNLAPLLNASARLTTAAAHFDAAVTDPKNASRLASADVAPRLDAVLAAR